MDYTQSNSYSTHAGTGRRMHEDAKAVPTMVSDDDLNSVIWGLMEIVAASGVAPKQFDAGDPSTYRVLLTALRQLTTGRVRSVQAITTSSAYTPSAGARIANFRGVAPGGAGGGCLATGAGQSAAGGGGSAGCPFDFWVVTALVGQVITMGAAGNGVVGANGGAGGDLVIGTYATIKGGAGGGVGTPVGSFPNFGGVGGGAPASTSSGVVGAMLGRGQAGGQGLLLAAGISVPGVGGPSPLGSGGTMAWASGSGYGSGGQGGSIGSAGAAVAGNGGAPGILIITEYGDFA